MLFILLSAPDTDQPLDRSAVPTQIIGVLGGVIAFGIVGMFIGPVLLAVGYSLMSDWTGTRDPIVKQKGEQEA